MVASSAVQITLCIIARIYITRFFGLRIWTLTAYHTKTSAAEGTPTDPDAAQRVYILFLTQFSFATADELQNRMTVLFAVRGRRKCHFINAREMDACRDKVWD